MSMTPIIACLIGASLSWFVIWMMLRLGYAGAGSEDIQHHHTHTGVIPRVGGIGIMVGFTVVFATCFFLYDWSENDALTVIGVFGGAAAAFLLGFSDDNQALGAKLKLLVQLLIGSFAYFCGLKINKFGIPFTGILIDLEFIGFLVTVVWFVALMNLINLIDGLDGLAGGIGLFLMLLLAYLAFDKGAMFTLILSMGMVGAIIGFLFHNFPPAKVYMGDSGAYLIGFLIAALSLQNSEKGAVVAALIAPVMALALPIADVTFAILRRGIKGLPMFRADQGHIHHRLLRTGLSHRQTVLLLYAVSLFALVGGLLAFADQGRYLPIFIGFAFVIILIALRGQKITAASIQTMFTESVQSRQDARNALALKSWFLMEVERADTGKNLWTDYHFVLRKMGFCSVEMTLNGDQRSFFIPGTPYKDEALIWEETHELKGDVAGTLRLCALNDSFSERQFALLSDLALETWVQASNKWKELHGGALDFKAKGGDPENYNSQKARSLYRPTY